MAMNEQLLINDASEDFVPHCQTYHVNTKLSPEENAREIRKLYGDDEYSQPASVMECTGVESSVCTAAFTVRRGGTLSTSNKMIVVSRGTRRRRETLLATTFCPRRVSYSTNAYDPC